MGGLSGAAGGGGAERGLPQAVRCPACGTGSHPEAAFCAVCGAALRARPAPVATTTTPAATTPARWEYLDARLPVELYPLEDGFLDAFDAALTAALGEYGRDRWEPASPTDWRELVATDRFVAGMRPGPVPGLAFLGERPVVRELLLRFRRAA